MIDLHEIFTICSWRNINSKYFKKMWLSVKYFLLAWRNTDVIMHSEYKLACLLKLVLSVSTLLRWWTVSGSLIKKMLIVSALSNMGTEVRHLTIQKLNYLTSDVCWCTVFLEGVKVKRSPQVCESDRFGHFCDCNGKTSTVCHHWIGWSLPSKQSSYSATDSTGWDKQACTHGTLWRQHYVTTSKKIFN